MRYFWLVLLIALSACVPARRGVDTGDTGIPLRFEVVPGQTAIERFDPPGAGATVALTLSAQVTNPNPFGVTLESVEYEVALMDRTVTAGVLEPNTFVAAGEQAPVRFLVSAELANPDLMVAVAKAFTTTPLPFRISGTTTFRSAINSFTTPPATLLQGETMARDIVEPPTLRLVEGAGSAFAVRRDAPVVQVTLHATNPGSIGYFLYGQEVEVTLGGAPLVLQDIAPVPLPAGQESTFELLFYPELSELSFEARDALDAALAGLPTLLEIKGDLLLDVLGVDTYRIVRGWRVSGFIYDAEAD